MVIGILGDTHGRADAMAAGMRILADAGAQHFLHTGDVGSTSVIDHLAGLQAAFVFGNNDWDRMDLARYAERVGVQCLGNFGDLTLDDKRIAILHGDDYRMKQKILAEQQFDYVLQGHTHVKKDERIGKTRIINPGALHRANPKTVATLDIATDQLRFHIVSM
jgi:putative phosphoesterase